jgi:general secretion pathway protein G
LVFKKLGKNNFFQEGMNMLRKGFTLIELLIVITIIAILAGAAIPYVQDYVEESRYSRAKQDLDEIKNALVRWGVEKGPWPAGETTINPLVGPYLTKSLADPWGAQYYVRDASSTVQSFGADRAQGGGDDITEAFRPPLACTRCYYLDVNDNGVIDPGDSLNLKFTRPITDVSSFTAADLTFLDGTTLTGSGATELIYSGFGASMAFGITTPFKPGLSSFTIAAGTVQDGEGNDPKTTAPTTVQLR